MRVRSALKKTKSRNNHKEIRESIRWKNVLILQVDEGGGAFYGPKIDLKIRDAIGRTWQCSTVQADFNLPDRFNLEYIDRSAQNKTDSLSHVPLQKTTRSLPYLVGVRVQPTASESVTESNFLCLERCLDSPAISKLEEERAA